MKRRFYSIKSLLNLRLDELQANKLPHVDVLPFLVHNQSCPQNAQPGIVSSGNGYPPSPAHISSQALSRSAFLMYTCRHSRQDR